LNTQMIGEHRKNDRREWIVDRHEWSKWSSHSAGRRPKKLSTERVGDGTHCLLSPSFSTTVNVLSSLLLARLSAHTFADTCTHFYAMSIADLATLSSSHLVSFSTMSPSESLSLSLLPTPFFDIRSRSVYPACPSSSHAGDAAGAETATAASVPFSPPSPFSPLPFLDC
jgi:hypothetical protein